MKILKRLVVIAPFILLEIWLLYLLIHFLAPYSVYISTILTVVRIFVILFIVSSRQESNYKLLWTIIVMLMPIAGTVMYLLFGNRATGHRIMRKINKARKNLPELPEKDISDYCKAHYISRLNSSLKYVEKISGFPIADCESVEYFPLGEDYWYSLVDEIQKAEKYIFLEFFIVQEGLMWSTMRDLLAQKVQEGVDVRFIYDDLGSIGTFSGEDTKKLERAGIKYVAFNRLTFLRGSLNNRTHRKMVIIDGKVAFTGGINLADEYINAVERFGHWKDIGFKITGPAVANYLHMFVQVWNAISWNPLSGAVYDFVPETTEANDGYVLSYYDSPANYDPCSNNFYIEMLGNARERAWFYTPYLILGDGLLDALVRAAKRGVDVRIIMPGIPDKKTVFRLSRSFYRELIKAGVKIYEYTPGFVHAKASLYDDDVCTVGTVNLDYRSLFLHFENNSIFVDSSIHKALEDDYLDTLEKCKKITAEDLDSRFLSRILTGFIRVLAPLM